MGNELEIYINKIIKKWMCELYNMRD